MSTETPGMIINGGLGASASKSPAALLEEQHARDEVHRVIVEDVVDEDDIQHPPPSVPVKKGNMDASESVKSPGGAVAPIVEESISKAKPDTPVLRPNSKKAPVFDVRSEELFPALGGGRKPRAASAMPMAWGA